VTGFSRKTAFNVIMMSWNTLWSDLVRMALYRDGPIVSEIGTTWLDTLVSMEGLRPFTPAEISILGNAAAYLPAAAQCGTLMGRPEIWGLPWLVDTRVIYYWRDLLEKAQVEEAGAFSSSERMADTLHRLRASGNATPWAVATAHVRDVIYNITPWVRGRGGDFVSDNGRQLLIQQLPALQGLTAYFELYRFMPGWPEVIIGVPAIERFRQRQVAAILGGPWLLRDMQLTGDEVSAETKPIGIAAPPGPPFVGGTDLVMWKHGIREDELAGIELLHYLFTSDNVLPFCQLTGLLPSRLDLLAHPFYADNPYFRQMIDVLAQGRTHPRVLSWGLIEERLTRTLVRVEQELRANPAQDVAALLARLIEPMVERLEVTLETTRR
jgi:multiple sugar transport system substrate-binding protein